MFSDPQQPSERRQEGMFGDVEEGIIPVVSHPEFGKAADGNQTAVQEGETGSDGEQADRHTDSCPPEPISIHYQDSNLMSATFVSIQTLHSDPSISFGHHTEPL